MTLSDPEGCTGQVARWLAGLDLSAVPGSVQERARYVTLDGVACALVGAQLPWSRVAVDAVLALEGTPDGAVLIGTGRSTTPSAAALLNGTFIQGFELDDYHPLGPLHSASVVIPAALSAASTRAVDGRTLLAALIAGYELGPRVGMALHGGDMISCGWHSGSIFGTHAAAAAAGVVGGLDESRFEDALGLAATQSSGLMAAQYEAMCKRMHHGFAARAGLYAAALAARGFTGIKRVFERDYGGYLSTFGQGGRTPAPAEITDELGERWEIERISIKPYAVQGGTHAAVDAILELRARPGFDPANVAAIDVWVGHTVYHHGVWATSERLTEIEAQMSMAYGIAVALLDGQVSVEQFRRERLDGEDVRWVMRRITAHHDPRIDDMGPQARLHTRLRITWRDGRRSETTVGSPTGGLERPLDNNQVLEKATHLLDLVMTPQRRDALVAAVLDLGAGRVRPADLVELLAAPVSAVL